MRFPKIIHLDVTYRKAEEMVELENKIKQLENKIDRMDVDIHRFSLYAAQNLQLMDDLRYAKTMLDNAGLDSSFIKLGPLYHAERST